MSQITLGVRYYRQGLLKQGMGDGIFSAALHIVSYRATSAVKASSSLILPSYGADVAEVKAICGLLHLVDSRSKQKRACK